MPRIEHPHSVIKTIYPALSDVWIQHLFHLGNIETVIRDKDILEHDQDVQCVFVLDGLLINQGVDGMHLLTKGDVFGLRETLFSVDLSYDEVGSGHTPLVDQKMNLVSITNETTCLVVDGAAILSDMESKPNLREGWLYVLNTSFEKQLHDGLDNYELDTLDRLRRVLHQIKLFADEKFALSIKHIQALTGISRSSIYRCIKTLEEEEKLVFCNKGHICFCTADAQKKHNT